MNVDEKYMNQCLTLAKKGIRNVAPNPMVGCVIVHQNIIIGEGYHQDFGGNHAEVNAINSIINKDLLKESILYVNLEPCAHFGKTPPCADLIIKNKIPKVVIGCIDSFSEVSGKGVEKMEAAGINVIVGVLENKSLKLNKRFFAFHNKKRPYIILKWAETKDGFIDVDRTQQIAADNWITSHESKKLVHLWRSEEQAIMVGTNTALNDNPELNVREVEGLNPLRIILDLNLRLPNTLKVFNQKSPSLVINYLKQDKSKNLEFIKIEKDKDIILQIFTILYKEGIQSVIVEGGTQLINTFIKQKCWDEARVFIGDKYFKHGLKAPMITDEPNNVLQYDSDSLSIYFND
jgi:diaminohydroxyphosphoribosylaminopyrimidine deaminase/5-amino-6-(5-phosphoribosylamino)uracil reductase